MRRQLLAHKGYQDTELPTVQTIRAQLNALGDFPKKAAQSTPQKNPANRRHLPSSASGQSRGLTTLVIHLDNGPENPSHRTQCMQRMVHFVRHSHLHVR